MQLEFKFEESEKKFKVKDNDKIKEAEKRFYNGDKNALVDIYEISYKLADKYIHSESKKKRFFIKREDVLEKCNNIGLYILEQYLSRPGFRLKTPSAYIWLRVMRELYYRDWTAKHIVFTEKL